MNTRRSCDLELTPAASERLDRNVERVRQEILREISRRHRGSDYRARASDVDNALNDLASRYAPSRTIWWAAWIAAGIATVGLVTALVGQVGRPEKLWPAISAALAAGIASATTLAIVGLWAMRRRGNLSMSSRQFVAAFDVLESGMRQQSRELMGSTADVAGLGRVISAVELLQLWTPEDSQEFRRLLVLRNAIVHDDRRSVYAKSMATGFDEMAHLSRLLTANDSDASRRMKDITTHRTARAFTDRVASALREAGIDVISAHDDVYYNFIASSAGLAKRIVVKYRKLGPLSVHDIADVVDKSDPDAETWIITNAAVSPYAEEYVQLARDPSGRDRTITIVSWQDDYPPTLLRGLGQHEAKTE